MEKAEVKQTRCEVKYLHVQPTKLRRVLDQIRGKSIAEAMRVLTFATQSSSGYILKALKSAVSNAVQNDKLDLNRLVVSEARANQALILRRWRARSRGMAAPRQKKWSHLYISVQELN